MSRSSVGAIAGLMVVVVAIGAGFSWRSRRRLRSGASSRVKLSTALVLSVTFA